MNDLAQSNLRHPWWLCDRSSTKVATHERIERFASYIKVTEDNIAKGKKSLHMDLIKPINPVCVKGDKYVLRIEDVNSKLGIVKPSTSKA